MIFTDKLSETESIALSSVHIVIETADLLLIQFDTRILLLQKKDLSESDIYEFIQWFNHKVSIVRITQ